MGLHSLIPSILVQEKTMKKCRVCGEEKPLTEYHKAKGNADGHENRCKSCKHEANMADVEGRRRRSYKYLLKKEYNMTLADYDRMLEEQGGQCAICGTAEVDGRFCVDHNHATGEVRGLLCNGCNSGLGQLGDSISNLASAIAYLSEKGSYGES